MESILHKTRRIGSLAVALAVMVPSAFAQAVTGPEAQKWRAILDAPAPASGLYQDVAATYSQRARAARVLGDTERELAELETGVRQIGTSSASLHLWRRLAAYHSDRGNVLLAIGAHESRYRVAPDVSQRHAALAAVATGKAVIFDLSGARASLQELQRTLGELRAGTGWSQWGNYWQAEAAWATANYHLASGRLAEAAAAYQACLGAARQHIGIRFSGTLPAGADVAFFIADCSSLLVSTLLSQGALADAAAVTAEYRTISTAYAKVLGRPEYIARIAPHYARLAMEQGRQEEARGIVSETIARLVQGNAPEYSTHILRMRRLLAQIEMVEGEWAKAEQAFRARAEGLRKGRQGNVPERVPEWAYALIRLGRVQEALDMMKRIVKGQSSLFDESSITLWESRAFLGVAQAAAGERGEAFRTLSAAIPKVLELGNGERSSGDSGVVRAKRLSWLLDGYLRLLSEYHLAGETAPIDVVNEAFRMADLARGSTVQRALAASAARANVSDPALAGLIRQEQDLQHEISALADAITNLLSRGRIAEQDKIVADMRRNLEKMRAQQVQVARDLQRRYPEYAGLIDPKPLGIAEVQKLLKPQEAMVSVYVGSERMLIWAIPAQGKPVFAVSKLNEADINARVRSLRAALDPAVGVPEYDFDTAFELYGQLLAPVEAGWISAKELIVVPHGALGSLPFSVLTTAPFMPKRTEVLFDAYTDAPWLLKKVAISQLPAALSIAALRAKGQASRTSKAFVGFGDPVFSENAKPSPSPSRGISRRTLEVRASEAQLKDLAGKADLSLLQALPDTAAEIEGIAKVLNADATRDIFLQRRASEANVKAGDVSDYRVVMFATHGLVPGEMPGLYQPALALSNPALTGEKEDGFLLMEEILALKLNADWVVLSACNTASSSGQGGEAVSGLGRAFFYAGAKALLVSSWPVETVSARLLTTDIFRRQVDNRGLSRSGALRESALDLIRQRTANYSYAHPLFWAPFIVVGDGG